MTPAATPTRKLSTAEERREAVLRAAGDVFAERGIHGTSTAAIAKAAGISHAYLFRLFPTKDALAIATVGRCNERIEATFARAAAEARRDGRDVLEAMGHAYVELLADRTLPILQLHAHAAAASVPEIRDAMREGFRRLVELVQRESGAPDEAIQSFFAEGMLINVLAAMDAPAVDAPWARLMMGGKDK